MAIFNAFPIRYEFIIYANEKINNFIPEIPFDPEIYTYKDSSFFSI